MKTRRRNPLKTDPSRTSLLRRQFVADVRRRCLKLAQDVQELLVDDDAFGLAESKPLLARHAQAAPKAYAFETDAEKLTSFHRWFNKQVKEGLLQTYGGESGKPWTSKYVTSSYRQGLVRSYAQAHKAELGKSADFYAGTQVQFLESAFASPGITSKLELLSTRAFENMRGLTDAMRTTLSRDLADGFVRGDSPLTIARQMRKDIGSLSRTRAFTIARTEIIHAQAEGQLDSLEMLGIDTVRGDVEWSTAGDELVCKDCQDMLGKEYSISEARGLIPLHPNCRCAWVPVIPENYGQKRRR